MKLNKQKLKIIIIKIIKIINTKCEIIKLK